MNDQPLDPPITWAPERSVNGQFLPGQGGRPRNAKNKISRDTLTAVQNLSSLAVMKLRERIEAGDMAAIKLCLDATLPRAGRMITTDTTDPLAIADFLAAGEITPDEANTMASALTKLHGVAEIEELRRGGDLMEAVLNRQR